MKTFTTLLLLLAFSLASHAVCNSYANVYSGSCDAYCNGQVEIGVYGGIPPYTLKVDGIFLATLQTDGGYLWNQACQGFHNYQFIDAAACTTSGTFNVYFRNPIIHSTITASGATSFCAPGSVTLSAWPGYFYQWYRDGQSITGANSDTYVATTSGNYYCYLMDFIFCNVNSNTITVNVSAAPPSIITASGSTTICNGSSVVLNNTVAAGTTYQWSLNNVPIPGETQASYSASAAGSYTCEATNSCGTAVSNALVVTVISGFPPAPVITAGGPVVFCTGGSVTFSVTTGPNLIYLWMKNGISINGANGTSYTATTAGNYSCAVLNACGSTYSNIITVTINSAAPTATITAGGATTFCSPGSVTLSANTGTGFSYQWRKDAINISGATLVSYSAATTGSYDCVVSNGCGNATSNAIVVTVNNPPTAVITANGPTSFCSSGSVTLNANTGTGLTYSWKRNGGFIGGANSDSYVATSSGTYDCLVLNSCGSTLSNSIVVTVNTAPFASITTSGPTAFCPGGSVTFTANAGAGLSYQWKRNGVIIPGETSISYVATTAGNYLCVVSNTCGGSNSNTITVILLPLPTAVITPAGPTTFCSGGSVVLNANTGGGLSYQWSLNGVNISGATTSSITATTGGDYACVVSNSCGSASNVITVTVNVAPTAVITAGGPVTFCSPGSVTLSANTGTGLVYQWRLNGTGINGATSASYVAAAGGNYDCVVSNTCGNVTSNTIAVTVNVIPSASISAGGPTTFCSPGSVTLNANSGTGLSYQWRLNTVNISGATSASFIATSAGNYSCTVSNVCGSSVSNSISVTVIAAPTATITANGPTTFCTGGSVLLSANTGTGLTYTWKKNGTTISGATTSSYTATTAGSYTVVVSNSCGSATSSAVVITIGGTAPAQPGTITGPGTFCSGQAGVIYSIAAVAGATSYNWQVPTGAVITSGQGTVSITVTFGNKNGKIKVAAINSCGTSIYASKNVNKNCREGGEAAMDLIPEMVVFPNPTSSQFTLKIDGADNAVIFILRDITGRELQKKDLPQGVNQFEFGSDLPPGIYLVEIIYGENRSVIRLIKD